jgi:hypothetical protein
MNANRSKPMDAFTLGLGAQTLKSPVLTGPVIANDRINAAIAERLAKQTALSLDRAPENQPDTEKELHSFWYRLWHRTLRRAA